MEEAIAITLGDDTTSFLVAVQQALHPLLWNKSGSLAIKPEMYYQVFSEVEIYIKGKDRIDLIESLPDCQIDIFGSSIDGLGWTDYFQNRSNITVHPPVPYTEALEIMKQSKIVLNSCITAAACGAVCVTNRNNYLTEQFVDEEEMIFYSRKDLSKLQPAVKKLLNDENRRLTVAKKGREVVMAHHTWDHRVRDLLKALPPILEKLQSH
jgi:glycosyltransferase involved in cell wall biosynthesis